MSYWEKRVCKQCGKNFVHKATSKKRICPPCFFLPIMDKARKDYWEEIE